MAQPSFQSPFVALALALLLCGCRSEAPVPPSGAVEAPAADAVVAYARGRVDIEGGLIRLAASVDGLVLSVHVEEGGRVRAGRLLAVIDDRAARLALGLSAASVSEARAAAAMARSRLAAAEREAARQDTLSRVEAAARSAQEAARDLVDQIRAEVAQAEAGIATAEARRRVDEFEVDQRSIRAPLDGAIVKRTARPGDGVSTLNMTPLFLSAPDAPRIVRADLDERFVDAVRPGMAAEIVIENDRPRSVAGRVLRVGAVFGAAQIPAEPGGRVDLRAVECVLEITDQDLRIG